MHFFASFNVDIVKTLTGAFNILKGTWVGMIATILRLSEGVLAFFTLLEKGGKHLGVDFDLNIEGQYEKTKALADKYSQESKDLISGAFAGGIKVDDSKGFGTLNDNALLPNSVTNSNVATNNNTQNNHIKIEVKADNPVLAGKTAVDALNAQISDGSKQFNVGGR